MATIREKGTAQWHAQIRRKGWPYQTATFRTKKDAQAWARKIESEMDRGLFVDRSASHRTTLKDLIELYLKEVTDERPSDVARSAERSRLERFLREEMKLCSYTASNLTPEHFEDYRDRRLKQPAANQKKKSDNIKLISPGTVKRELTLLKSVIDYRLRRLGLKSNPVNTFDVTRPIVNDERDVRLTEDELKRLFNACANSRNPWLLPILEMGFETGARRGSLLKLKWEDVDIKGRSATLRGVKNSRSPEKVIDHTVGLSPRAIEILSDLPRSLDGRVFPLTANAFRLAFNRARKKADVEHFRFHDTRHERISSLFEAGWSDVQVMTLSGHKDPKSVKRYASLSKDHMADELAKLEKSIKGKGQT